MATTYDLNITQGSSFNIRLTAKDSNSNYINLSGYSVSGYIRNRFSDSSYLLDLEPVIVSGQSDPTTLANLSNDAIFSGLVDISILPTGSASLPITQAIYDIEVYAPSTTLNIYTSDFGGGTDGWTVSINGSIHTENPYNTKANALVFVLDDCDTCSHALKAPVSLEIGKRYKITGWVNHDAANYEVGGVKIYNWNDPQLEPSNLVWSTSTEGWNYIDVVFIASASDLLFYATDNDASPLTIGGTDGEDDEFAVADISIEKHYWDSNTVIKLLNGKANIYPEATY